MLRKYAEIKHRIAELEKREKELSVELRETLGKLQNKIEVFEQKYGTLIEDWKKHFRLILIGLGILTGLFLLYFFFLKKPTSNKRFSIWNFLFYQFILPWLIEQMLSYVRQLLSRKFLERSEVNQVGT